MATIPVQFTFFATTWIALVASHFQFSYAAMTCRGHPPLLAEHFTAIFITPLFVWMPALFAERKTRSAGVAVGAIGFTLIYAIVKTNLESPRPHIGHTHGVIGIVVEDGLMVLLQAAILYIPVATGLYFLERVLGDILGEPVRRKLSRFQMVNDSHRAGQSPR